MTYPKHIGIILDGNRRYAKKHLSNILLGHEKGAENVKKLLEWLKDIKKVKELTLYTFSMQNFNREPKEVKYLFNLFKRFFKNLDTKKITEEGLRINFIGRINLFPKDLKDIMTDLMEKTKDNKNQVINFAMAYGGREEIIDAIKKLGKEIKEGNINPDNLDGEQFSHFLYINSEPDLIIRTGGAHRTSNFLPWQGVYSEWFFLDKTWPEFEKEDLIKVIEEFSTRERRFGK